MVVGKGPPFLGGPEYFLFYPVFDLGAEPGGPLVNALAGAGGDGDDLDVGVQPQHMLFAGFQIKVKVGQHVDFVDQQHYISELEAKLNVYSHLAQAMDDIKLGRVQSAEDAFADILGELENLDI